MKRLLTIFCALLSVTVACGDLNESPGDDIQWMQEHTEEYLGDQQWRRAQLEASMWRPDLPYARKQLTAYGLANQGWDLLAEMTTEVAPVFPGGASGDSTAFSTEVPTTRREWLELGEAVFWQMPMRRDTYVEWLVERPELLEEIGVENHEDGSIQGLVHFQDSRGQERVGITCGFCHGEGGVAGQARRNLDLGLGRAVFNEAHNRSGDEFASWGPGRVDVTDDAVSDPLQIPDLWGVRHQSHVNASGVVELATPAALAIRFETQYILGHNLESRPNRVLTWALAMYVLSLDYPDHQPDMSSEGAAIFEANCTACHTPDSGFSGGLVNADLLSGDGQAAFSPFRGTGMLKVPALVGVKNGAPYLHNGQYQSLRALLEGGHPYGAPMEQEDIDHVLNFLNTL